ncbi:hypothetical protein DFH06DRAFT_1378337 [Mycena polygramma]|nr:hypothetical protein DFH06DRAFT_1378337 [Mycena polygramma]
MLSTITHNVSPFATTQPPPAPVVILSSATDLHLPTLRSLTVHEDLLAASKRRASNDYGDGNVPFLQGTTAPALRASVARSPTPPSFAEHDSGGHGIPLDGFRSKIPSPSALTRKVLADHPQWTLNKEKTKNITEYAHEMAAKWLDTTQAWSFQDKAAVNEVFKAMNVRFPELKAFVTDWPVKCILMAHLKVTSNASRHSVLSELTSLPPYGYGLWTNIKAMILAAGENSTRSAFNIDTFASDLQERNLTGDLKLETVARIFAPPSCRGLTPRALNGGGAVFLSARPTAQAAYRPARVADHLASKTSKRDRGVSLLFPSLRSLLARWAALLSSSSKTTVSVAIACDDAVAFSLFRQIKEREPKWRHEIARLSARDEDLINEAAAEELRLTFRDAQAAMLNINQTYEGLLNATANLINVQKWTRTALGEGYKLGQGVLWCLRATVVLLAPWSPVKLHLAQLGEGNPVQFGIMTKVHIPADTLIYELVGQLSSDSVDGEAREKTTSLSEMSAFDGSSRVLFGPIRFVNHSCDANTVFEQFESRTRAVMIRTLRDIACGEEVTVNYGPDYWEEGQQCLCGTCEPRVKKCKLGPSRIIDLVRKRTARQAKSKGKKENRKQKKRVNKRKGASQNIAGNMED